MRRFSFLVMMLALVATGAKAVDFSVGNLKYSEFRSGKSVYCLGLTSSASGNSSVTTITIPGWVTYNGVTYNVEGIDATAFYQEYYLKTVVVEWGVKQIDYGAFMSCTGIRSLALPSSLTKIGSRAFENTYIDDLYLSWLTPPTIADDVFHGAGLAAWRVWLPTFPARTATQKITAFKILYPTWGVNATIAHDVLIDGLPYVITKASTTSADGEATLVGPYSYSGALNLNATATGVAGDYTLTRHRYVGTAIADSAFAKNTSMTGVTIPSSYKTVGERAFSGATKLASANVASSNIGDGAFADCSALTTYTLGEGATIVTFGSNCLLNCQALTTVNVSSTVTNFDDNKFKNDNNFAKYVVNADNLYYSSDSQGLLYDKNKTSLYHCPPKATLSSLPGTLRTIRYAAFYFFAGDKVVVPFGVTTISQTAFVACSNLKFLKIPSTVGTTAGIIYSASNLQELILGHRNPPSQNCFRTTSSVPANLKIKVPARAVSAYKASQAWSGMADKIDMGGFDVMFYLNNNVNKTIFTSLDTSTKRAYITYGCDEYRGNTTTAKTTGEIDVPSTVTYNGVTYTVYAVDDYAFYNATSLNQVTLPKGIQEVGMNVWLNNPETFRCYVPNEEAGKYNTAIRGYSDSDRRWYQVDHALQQMYIYLRNDNGTVQTFSPQVVDIKLPTEPNFYIVTTYNTNTATLATEKLQGGNLGVKAGSAMLVTDMEQGKIYRFDKPVAASRIESPLFGCGWSETGINTANFRPYYFDGSVFKALTGDLASYRSAHPGEAVLALYTGNVSGIDTFKVDILASAVKGDVNGDGVVSGADVTALYGYLLDGSAIVGDGDVNGDTVISGADVTALYEILLNQ